MAENYATVDAWLAYYRNQNTPINDYTRKYAEGMAAARQAPPDAGKSVFEENNAYRTITSIFESYGLGSLAPKLLELIQAGYDTEAEIDLMLRDTAEYKERFKANEARQKAGLSTLTPAEYVAMERQYGQIMRAAGMPQGFYDSTDDFTEFLAKDVSVNEVNQRVAAAKKAAFDTPDDVRSSLFNLYGVGSSDIAAYFLDPDRAMPLLERQQNAALAAAGAKRSGFTLDRAKSELLGTMGVDDRTAQQGYQQIADVLPTADKLDDIYGDAGTYDLSAAESEAFGLAGADKAQATRKKLASAERASFSGSTGTTRGSLGTNRKGSV
jgi:hypothetical protein